MFPHCSPLPSPPHPKKNMKNYYYPAHKLSSIQSTPKHTVGISSYGIKAKQTNPLPIPKAERKRKKKNHDI
jgi:hypothetical protein